jgi:serine/threonine protein kinase
MNLQIGSTIGDYQVVGILGAGGMGKVYKVRNVISDRVEAMKVLLPDLANAPELADRFLREIKVQASLEHPNIASLHTAVRVDNQLLMLMEFVDGVTVEQKLKDGPLPVPQAVDYITQVLSALDYAHAHGVIHRDIKPANMMLTPGGVVKLMDFGIAKASTDHKLTMTGTTMGSLYYMSPEQIQGAASLDARADLYSVGVSLYEMLTGKRPFDGDSQFAIMSAHLEKTPVPPIQLDPRMPQILNDVILMSVMKDPAARFQTAGAFKNALSNVAGAAAPAQAPAPAAAAAARGAITMPAPPPPPQKEFHLIEPTAPAKSSGKRGLWMALGAIAAVAAVVAVIQFAPWKGSKAATATPATTVTTTAPAPVVPAPSPSPSPEPIPQQPVAQQPAVSVPQTPLPTPTPQQPAVKPPRDNARVATSPQPRPASPQVVPQQHAPAQQPQVQQAAPTQQPAAQQPSAQQPAAPAGPSRAELQEVREKLVQMDNRAQGIHGTLRNLQRAQEAQGFGLGSQYTGPAGLMDTYLRGASDALNAGDPASARRFLDKAEPPMSALERLLNK